MDWLHIVFLYLKYALAIVVIMTIALAPAWISRQTKKNKTASAMVRIYSWLFGWTGIGWLYGLYLASKK
jgi:hypothetical protein